MHVSTGGKICRSSICQSCLSRFGGAAIGKRNDNGSLFCNDPSRSEPSIGEDLCRSWSTGISRKSRYGRSPSQSCFYRDASTEEALADTERFIQEVQAIAKTAPQGVYPVVTPRFVPSCTDEGLAGLGALAEKYDVHVQTHCSEGQWEHDFVQERFGKTDTEVLQDFGLLREKAVMAHGNFISPADGVRFVETGAAVAHCPISNAYFANGVIPIKRLKNKESRLV